MSTLLSALGIHKVYLWAAIALTVMASVGTLVLYIVTGARNKERLNQARGTIRDYEVAARTKADLDRLSADAARAELRRRWGRK